jgi:hypothetical protein
MTAAYYANGKRGTMDGCPIWRPAWWGTLGNDAEFREATKPRTAFKAAYYKGGHRLTIDGAPCRVAGNVANWAPWMRRALGRGTMTTREENECKAQITILLGGKP